MLLCFALRCFALLDFFAVGRKVWLAIALLDGWPDGPPPQKTIQPGRARSLLCWMDGSVHRPTTHNTEDRFVLGTIASFAHNEGADRVLVL